MKANKDYKVLVRHMKKNKMKVPMKISTLHDLAQWTVSNVPGEIVIGKRSKLRKMREFNPENTNTFWRRYRGIRVKYL